MFQYPVGVQLFNRPEYAERVLRSLKSQRLPIAQNKLIIYIDGFRGSIYETRNVENNTEQISKIASEIFPFAKLVIFEENQGIAALHNALQAEAFLISETWAAFFEEDIVLDENYMSELSELINIVDSVDEVAKVACFQIISSIRELSRGYDGFYPGTGTKAYAERKSFFLEKQKIIERYIALVNDELSSDSVFVNVRKASILGAEGHLLPFFQKDALVESFLHFEKRLHVVSMPNLATDIGINGIHNYVTPKLKKEQGTIEIEKTIEVRKDEFMMSLPSIRREAVNHIVGIYEEVLKGFHTSRSRKAMLKKSLISTLAFLKK